MGNFLYILIAVGAIATLVVLVRGVMLMASGKDITGERQNRLMMNRVILQAATIVVVIIFLLFMRGGH